MRVLRDGKWGYLRENGEVVVPCDYNLIGEPNAYGLIPVTSGGKHVNMIFDLQVPSDSKMPTEEAAKRVAERISEKNPDCYAVIKAEHPFI